MYLLARNNAQGKEVAYRDTDGKIADAGWVSVRIWEHEDAADAARRVEEIVRARM